MANYKAHKQRKQHLAQSTENRKERVFSTFFQKEKRAFLTGLEYAAQYENLRISHNALAASLGETVITSKLVGFEVETDCGDIVVTPDQIWDITDRAVGRDKTPNLYSREYGYVYPVFG